MKTILNFPLFVTAFALLTSGSIQAADLFGYGWWGGWDIDYAQANFRFSLADGAQALDGDYRVFFYERTSGGALNTYIPAFSILNGQIVNNGSWTAYSGPIGSSGDQLSWSSACEGVVYRCAYYNSGCQDWQPFGSVLNNPHYTILDHYIDNPYPANNFSFDVPIIVQVGSCSEGKPGTASPDLGSLDWSIDLGKADFGRSRGNLRILSATARPELSSPTFLIPAAPSPGFDLRLDAQYAVRQVLTPTALVQVSNDTEDGSTNLYKIDFLTRPNPLVDTNGFWITEVEGSTTNQTQYLYDPTNLLWTLTFPGSLSRQTLQTVSSNATQLVIRKSVFKPGTPDQLVYREDNTYTNVTYVDAGVTNLTGFTFLIKQVVDPDAAQSTTTYDYYWDPTETDRFKKLKQKINADGSWARHDYGSNFDKLITPINNSLVTDSDNLCRVVSNSYTNTVPQITTVETALGQVVSRKYRKIENGSTYTDIECQDPNAAYTDASNLVTVKTIDGAGQTTSLKQPDGTMAFYTYSTTTTNKTTTSSAGQPNGSGSAIQEGAQMIAVVGTSGEMLSKITYLITGGSVDTSKVLEQELYAYASDDYYKLTPTVLYLDGTTTSGTQCSCGAPGPTSTTDKDGTVTYYTYDSMNRQIATQTLGITTTNVLDAAGHTLATIRIGTNGWSI